ncbi:hypothetical protein [Actinomycetospora atypica]|uniref:Uncharacterized protein n=1 Tax=Actinomycetospora atypica TaxID=1290095 RepID=A0ABV9YWX3_9PSEU
MLEARHRGGFETEARHLELRAETADVVEVLLEPVLDRFPELLRVAPVGDAERQIERVGR